MSLPTFKNELRERVRVQVERAFCINNRLLKLTEDTLFPVVQVSMAVSTNRERPALENGEQVEARTSQRGEAVVVLTFACN